MPKPKPKLEPRFALVPSVPKRHKFLAYCLSPGSSIDLRLQPKKVNNPTSTHMMLDEEDREEIEPFPIHSLFLTMPQTS